MKRDVIDGERIEKKRNKDNDKYSLLIIVMFVIGLSVLVIITSDLNVNANQTNLLFVYDSSCVHCIKTIPIIDEFKKNHNEVYVISVKYNEMNDEQKNVVGDLKGVPTIIFYDENNKTEILGEISLKDLGIKYKLFKGED